MQPVYSYTLPPDKLIQAVQYAQARNVLYFTSLLISILVLLTMIRLRLVPRMRRFHPLWIIVIVVLITAAFDLPSEMYAHAMSLRYHISVEAWPAWFWDWTKGQCVSLLVAIAVLGPLYWLLRKSPSRWWFHAWLVSIPVMLVSAYADPLLFEPLFNNFQPLSAKRPELIVPIERLLRHAGVTIPQDHLFEMQASEKTNALNAYFSGFGPSQRLVLYDTIIAKEQGPPLLTTIGHELGHFVLRHIAKGLAFGSVCLLAGLWILSRLLPYAIRRWGQRYDVHELSQWPSLPILLLAVVVLGFFAEPIGNAFSRFQEHQADVYSLEVTHGIIPDPGQAAAQAFQVEGETDLEAPSPHPFIVFWLYSHPPVAQRLHFSLHYDPWSYGQHPEFVAHLDKLPSSQSTVK